MGPENEVIRRAERERSVEKTNNAAFPPVHHATQSVVRCIAPVRAVADLGVVEGVDFVKGETCTMRWMQRIARGWVRYIQTTLAGAV